MSLSTQPIGGPADLLRNPIWHARSLGSQIPPSRHAISVALPNWDHVVGYEEKRPDVVEKLVGGYPRFVIHPIVQQLAAHLAGNRPCLPFPSSRAAATAADFVRNHSIAPAEVVPGPEVTVVATTADGETALRQFWQHTGLIVSTRRAEATLGETPEAKDSAEVAQTLRQKLAEFYECEPGDVFLTVTGMAAQYEALQAVKRYRPGLPTVQLGFPYVDTLKLQQKLGQGAHLIHNLVDIEAGLRKVLAGHAVAAAFAEIPGNPLLGSADLRRITPLLRQHRVPLIADDVVATPFNVDLSEHADLIATSLTKFLAGTGDVMGGALICNPRSSLYPELKQLVATGHEELLWVEDARVIAAQARTFPERMASHNRNGLLIAERLRTHPAVERVWYPKWESNAAYEAVRRPSGGYGALLTFLPRDSAHTAPKIYDRLHVCKGPSLGTIFSLACPFTLLAHYTELEWAEACGVPRNLIRLSIGLEDPEDLWTRIDSALRG
jgi:cystathionine gamma-synthase